MAVKKTKKFAKRWQQYSHPIPQGKVSSSTMKKILSNNYQLEDNVLEWRSFRFEPSENGLSLYVMDKAGKESKIALGYKEWKTSPISFYPPNSRRSTLGSFSNIPTSFLVGGAYAWGSHNQLEVKLHFVNWMSAVKLVFNFQDDKMHVDIYRNFDNSHTFTRKKFSGL